MTSPALQKVALAGSVNATADAAWGKTFNDLVARTDATIDARVAPVASSSGNAVPLTGAIHARYDAPSKQIALNQSYLRTAQTSVALNGTASDRSALQVRMQANDLHELETVADIFRTPTPGKPPQPLGLYGTATFTGAIRGSTAAPQITGQLYGSNLRVHGSEWRVLRTNVQVSPSVVSLGNGDLQPADRGRITFNLRAGLRRWSFTESSPFEIGLNAAQINAADLAKAAGLTTPVSGTLAANVSVSGTELNPVGQGN